MLRSIISALILIVAFSSPRFSLLVWVAFVPLFWEIEKRNPAMSAICAFLSGIVFNCISLFWLTSVTWIGYPFLCIYVSLYWAVFGYLWSFFNKRVSGGMDILLGACLWTALEYLRGNGPHGFPWLSLGTSLYTQLSFVHLSSMLGTAGTAFPIVFCNILLSKGLSWAFFAENKKNSVMKILKAIIVIIAIFLGVFCLYSFGSFRLKNVNEGILEKQDELRVCVVQGSIPQEKKWDSYYFEDIVDTYEALIFSACEIERPDLFVLPETCLPDYLMENEELFERVASWAIKTKSFILLGSPYEENTLYYNSAFLISPEGKVKNRYDKVQLVPYGEYVPFRKIVPFINRIVLSEADFSPGNDLIVFSIKNISFGALICFEDAFPSLLRLYRQKGVSFAVNMTNDAWFGPGPEPRQHLSQAVFAAAANGLEIARATNTGISCFLSSNGKVCETVKNHRGRELYVSGTLTSYAGSGKLKPTFYVLYGDVFSIFCLFLVIISLLYLWTLNYMRYKTEGREELSERVILKMKGKDK
ncbi:MAG: apolipoprotein N-acyltransferase [Candidatus Theseobacter exili]|nr:apolipoprotein N-acyltransferase [Candidatus Theseobacter exili]